MTKNNNTGNFNFTDIDKIVIMGTSGCGKSYLGKVIQLNFSRVIVFDPMDEYQTDQKNIIRSWEQFASFVNNEGEKNKFFKVIKFSFDDDDIERISFLDHAIKVLYHLGNVTIVIEEMQLFSTPHSISKNLKNSMTTGRHQKLSFIITTQRPSLMNKTILSQSTHIFCGNLVDKNDILYVGNFIGADKNQLSSLKKGQFIWFHPQREEKIKVISTY
jgi:ABC-type dipeptide/oligopeptide/nickel transport system ATPase component